MKIKALGFVCASLVSVSTFAQSTSVTAPVAAAQTPKSELSFTPSVFSGVHSDFNGNFNNAQENAHTVGPFITPGVEIGFQYNNLKGVLAYGAEISGARGFGKGKAGTRKMADNFYAEHNPMLKATVGNGIWNFNMLSDLKWHIAKASANTFSEYFINPDIERVVNENFALSLGYVLHRKNNFDTDLGVAALGKLSTAEKSNTSSAAVLAATAQLGQTPLSSLHAAVLTGTIKSGNTKLVTYIRGGRRISNQETTAANSYRLQSELTTQPTKPLTLILRYRLNMEDTRPHTNIYNLGRITVSYAVNKNWSVDVLNETTILGVQAAGGHRVYENEQYAGLTYKF